VQVSAPVRARYGDGGEGPCGPITRASGAIHSASTAADMTAPKPFATASKQPLTKGLPSCLGARDIALGLASPLAGRGDAIEAAADCVQKRVVAERAADQLAPPQRGEGRVVRVPCREDRRSARSMSGLPRARARRRGPPAARLTLEWGQSQARPTRRAGAGLSATVRAAAIKWSSSMATEPNRPQVNRRIIGAPSRIRL